ncbi:Uncharacterized protein FWK35_00031132, partial [Aphis craccivora]
MSIFEKEDEVLNLLNGEIIKDDKDLAELSPEDISCFKYAAIVSVDVERNFSKYKVMLRDNRKSFQFNNLKTHFFLFYEDFHINYS